jgi:hypothetical protein
MATEKAWGGRFTEDLDEVASKFMVSVEVDKHLGAVDVRGSIAHAEMLCAIGVLTVEERDAITAGLSQIGQELERGAFVFDPAREDVHMNVEAELTARRARWAKAAHGPLAQRPGRHRPAALRARARAATWATRSTALALALVAAPSARWTPSSRRTPTCSGRSPTASRTTSSRTSRCSPRPRPPRRLPPAG